MTNPDKLGKLRSAARAAGFAGWTLLDLAGVKIHQRAVADGARYEVWQRWMKAWVKGCLELYGVEQALVDRSAVPVASGPTLVVSNHRSPLDIALMLQHFGGHVLSRGDLANWPLIGLAARGAETIFVDRQNANSGLSAIRQIRAHLRQGRTVIIFPEGGTFPGDEVREFHAGAFAALKKLSVQIVTVGIAYDPGCEFVDETFLNHFGRVGARARTRVSICMGENRRAERSPDELAAHLRSEVQKLVFRARSHLESRY
jgi:lyso-ornithine lipid O-acyltransferase